MTEAFDNPLERYQIMDPLGRGGSGHTFRAVDRATSQQVAIKVLSLRDVGGDWKRFDLFEREVAVLRTLDHPGIPRFLDSYSSESTGDFFLVMELCEGQSLRQHLAEGKRLSADQLRDLLDQALTILDYLHGLSPPVIHRDIKPANLVRDPEGRLRLVDFGGVKRATHQEGGTTVIGTFGYMAPEQLHGEAGPSTDLYSLGATIVALHAGTEADQLPHDGLRIDLPALSLPPALEPVLQRMLEPEPKQRVHAVAQVRQLLQAPARPRQPTPVTPTQLAQSPEARSPAITPTNAPTNAMVPTSGLRSLARVPAPLSVLVWLFSAIGAGGLTVFQVIMLPLIVTIARQLSGSEPPSKRARLEDNLAELEATVGEARRSLSYVAKHTHPIRDD